MQWKLPLMSDLKSRSYRDSLLNGINGNVLSNHHSVKVENIAGGTKDTILENIDELTGRKSNCLIAQALENELKVQTRKVLLIKKRHQKRLNYNKIINSWNAKFSAYF